MKLIVNKNQPWWALSLLLAVQLGTASGAAHAAPYTPTSDAEVIETLPGRASDPATRRVDSLRKQLAARPDDAALRVDIARRYFDMAMAQGDPRYVGYAAGALAPLNNNTPGSGAQAVVGTVVGAMMGIKPADRSQRAEYFQVRGMIEQFNHQFDAALASLAQASQLNPTSPEPLLWRSAIYMVQAKYPEAAAECAKVKPLADPLVGIGCSAYVDGSHAGGLEAAFNALSAAVKQYPASPPELLLWQYTRLAEMALRLERFEAAEGYYKSALKLGIVDQFLLGSYADLLLARKRPAEVLTLLADWERSDILLLRLALAAKVSGDSRAAGFAAQLRDRFDAAARRGDRLHEQEAARFELDIERNPKKALALASANYTSQKEPRDAEILMRAALGAGQAAQARPALAWWRSSAHQDANISNLANQLVAQGAEK